jgi:mono/diheme cytochrome c family protein
MKIRSGLKFFTNSRTCGVAACGGAVVMLSIVSAQTPASGQAQSRPPVQQQTQRPATPGTQPAARIAGDVARGEYLVNSVALCVQCHSPRDQRGNLIARELLTGGAVPVRAPSWDSEWAYRAPALAGLPGFTDEQIVMLLTEGHAGDRPAPRRPMPPFRMNRADAEAIASYLRSR